MFGYLDCFSGVSGDKFLGALVAAGVPLETLRERLTALPIGGYELRARTVSKNGMAATKIDVAVTEEQPVRHWRDIRSLIESSDLAADVKAGSLRVFARLAEAEAAAHGVDVEAVHFHEVGAIDSIVDIVGTVIGLSELAIGELWATPVRLGHGTVVTSHGELPVPAPATSRLLQGIPVYAGELEGEMTTPTGAALVAALVSRFAPMPPLRVRTEGNGAGTRDFAIPNVLRLSVGELEMGGGGLSEVAVLQSVIDNATPEVIAAALAMALEDGALDAWADPVAMKKGRIGSEVTVLARTGDAARLTDLLMRHTGTLGVRRRMEWRQTAERRIETVETSLGSVRVKVQGSGPESRVRPESDDVAVIARRTGMALDRVARILTDEAEAALGLGS